MRKLKDLEVLREEVKIEEYLGIFDNELFEFIEKMIKDKDSVDIYYETIIQVFYMGHQRGQAQKRQELVNVELKGVM